MNKCKEIGANHQDKHSCITLSTLVRQATRCDDKLEDDLDQLKNALFDCNHNKKFGTLVSYMREHDLAGLEHVHTYQVVVDLL